MDRPTENIECNTLSADNGATTPLDQSDREETIDRPDTSEEEQKAAQKAFAELERKKQ